MFCLRSLVALAVLHRLQTLLPAGARSEVEKWYSLEMHDPIQDVTPGPVRNTCPSRRITIRKVFSFDDCMLRVAELGLLAVMAMLDAEVYLRGRQRLRINGLIPMVEHVCCPTANAHGTMASR